VEAFCSFDNVLVWHMHHRGLHDCLSLVCVVGELHLGPDPDGAHVLGAQVSPDHQLFAELALPASLLGVQRFAGPVECELVDVLAIVGFHVQRVEVRVGVAGGKVHFLSRLHFGLLFLGGDGLESGVQHIQRGLVVFSDCDACENAYFFSGSARTLVSDIRQVVLRDKRVNAVEIVR